MVYHPFRHLGLKFLAITIAVLLWLTVAGEPIVERSLVAPLELKNKPENLELINPPGSVNVHVRGLSSVLGQIDPGTVIAVLDLGTAMPGRHIFHITPSQVQAPNGVEVLLVTPGTITLQIELSGTKTVLIRPVTDGEPAEGFVVGSITVSPPTVEVVGPVSALKDLKEATADAVSINGASSRVEDSVNVAVMEPPLVRLRNPQTAKVTVEIVPAPVVRTVTRVPVHLRNASAPFVQSVPSAVTVDVRGSSGLVGGLQPDSIVAFVDLAGLGPGRYNLPVQVEPSRNFEVVRTQPARVSIRIK
jgi:YbbR domain-containing protein